MSESFFTRADSKKRGGVTSTPDPKRLGVDFDWDKAIALNRQTRREVYGDAEN